MQLRAILSKEDLVGLIDGLTPLDVEISRRPRRSISLAKPSRIELVPGAGLRVQGDARISWEVAALPVAVTVRSWRVLLEPSIVVRDDGAQILLLDPVLEELDFKRVPGFLDERIIEALNEALAMQRSKLAWNFTKTLSIHKPLSPRLVPPRSVDLVPTRGEVEVSSTEVSLTMHFQAAAAHVAETARNVAVAARGGVSASRG
jgi:hypothetical protein